MSKLNAKRSAFVAYYLGEACHNATEAARMAGYKAPGAEGHRLLKNAEIQKSVQAGIAKVQKKSIATREEVLGLLTKAARGEWETEVTPTDLAGKPLKDAAYTVPIKDSDRLKATQQLAKMQGWEAPKKVITDGMARLADEANRDPEGLAKKLRSMADKLESGAGLKLGDRDE